MGVSLSSMKTKKLGSQQRQVSWSILLNLQLLMISLILADLGFDVLGHVDVRRRQGGIRRLAVTRIAMGPNSSLDELALVTAARFVRPGEDSLLQGTFEPDFFNNTTVTHEAIAPNNSRVDGDGDRPEFNIDVGLLQSMLSNIETQRSLESYVPESSPEPSPNPAGTISLLSVATSASPELQKRPQQGSKERDVRQAFNSSLLTSQAESSPPGAQGMQPITINLFTEIAARSKVTERSRRSRSLDHMEIDLRTKVIHISPPRRTKRGCDTAELSTYLHEAEQAGPSTKPEEERPASSPPLQERLRPRLGRGAAAAERFPARPQARQARQTKKPKLDGVAKPNVKKE